MHAKAGSDTCDTDETVADGAGCSIPEYRETIALLHEEIVRLEQDLQSRGDRFWETVSTGVASAEDEVERSAANESAAAAQAEVERLKCELASGEETVALLLNELGLVEEAKAANRAEWEQMAVWVAELEQRVEGQDEDALRRLEPRLGHQQREVERTAVKNSDALHSRLGELQDERDELGRQLQKFQDERRLEGLEHEAALAELRTRLAQASLVQSEASLPIQKPEDQIRDLEPDLRIRALRQHLMEIHQREEERRQRSLTGRLSRLWSRTNLR
jgi:uncharacterized small protein (DUF1192 family)